MDQAGDHAVHAPPGDAGTQRQATAGRRRVRHRLDPFPPLVSAVTRITGWLDESPGAEQLVPDDPIFDEVAVPAEVPDIAFATFGGTSVRYARVYSWHFTPDSYVPNFGDFPDIRFDWTLFPIEVPIASPMMDSLPDVVVDDEQDGGEGDGLLADDRARLPGAPHQSLDINHAEARIGGTKSHFQLKARLVKLGE